MNRFFEFIDKHKFGIIAALLVYVGFFVYLHLETYQKVYVVSVWDERAELENPEIALKPENIEINPMQNIQGGEVKSISRDANDTREKSYDNWSREKAAKEAEQRVKEWEKQDFAESGGKEKQEQIKKELQEKNNAREKTTPKNTKTTNSGGDLAFKGNVMVDWSLKNRQPHQNDSWNVRNPGYTCGQGSSGTVFVKIKVDQGGRVVAATYIAAQSSNANDCMIEQALKYARLSRFNYDGSSQAAQEGSIRYTFVSQ